MPKEYPEVLLDDEALLKAIFDQLSAQPLLPGAYGDESTFGEAIRSLPVGLRAMAATHHLDVSLTIDSLGWHFFNFGAPAFVVETEAGLRELGLSELADIFHEAHEIVDPLKEEVRARDDYLGTLEDHGVLDRMDELNMHPSAFGPLRTHGKRQPSPIYTAWRAYARFYPERIFLT